mmetsp:Transcript_91087/g.195316  ORF Transcript_91087/g.195316 Transcript_91087/m.195316 type:complete len:216 (-) Transcript_91087:1440-2087(-)
MRCYLPGHGDLCCEDLQSFVAKARELPTSGLDCRRTTAEEAKPHRAKAPHSQESIIYLEVLRTNQTGACCSALCGVFHDISHADHSLASVRASHPATWTSLQVLSEILSQYAMSPAIATDSTKAAHLVVILEVNLWDARCSTTQAARFGAEAAHLMMVLEILPGDTFSSTAQVTPDWTATAGPVVLFAILDWNINGSTTEPAPAALLLMLPEILE